MSQPSGSREPAADFLAAHGTPELMDLLALDQTAPPPTTAALTIRQQRAQRLGEVFAAAVTDISFADVAVLLPGRRMPRSIDRFRLVPIVSSRPLGPGGNMMPAGYHCVVPPGIRTTFVHDDYHGNEGRPYIDTQQAIGWVTGDWLAVVAAAGIDRNGRARLKQIQDVTSCRKPADSHDRAAMKERHRTGLYDGIDWAATLTKAWGVVLEAAGIEEPLVIDLWAAPEQQPKTAE